MDTIDNKYLNNAITELFSFFGIKEEIDHNDLFGLLANKNTKEAIKLIASQLKLPIDINIVMVPNDYRQQSHTTKFSSTRLVPVDDEGEASAGIVAQVDLPSNLPTYGADSLNNFLISVKISENALLYPGTFSMIMAHELAHVLLYSLNHKNKNNEFYTDLTAMILGFNKLFNIGRKVIVSDTQQLIGYSSTITTTTRYGYLDDKQFDFAHNRIDSILSNCESNILSLIREARKHSRLVAKYNKARNHLNIYLNLLKTVKKTFQPNDLALIQGLYYLDYFDERDKIIKQNQEGMEKLLIILTKMNTYPSNIDKYKANLNHFNSTTNKAIKELTSNIKIIGKYIGIFDKIKTSLMVFFLCK